ncbi:MAG: aldehyde dehydrogenase (NADP(+)), partial [Oxalobacteraceae bacterium]
EPGFGTASADELAAACQLADQAVDAYRAVPLEGRARFLETIAERIVDIGPILIERAAQESGLPVARLEGERGRTVNQLRLFAKVVRDGHFLEATLDAALPQRTPPRPDLRMRKIPVGPVAVFGASNFPLAFSVAGGDTASALAAGCPVVVKAHNAHLGTSELVAKAVRQAAEECGMPEGVFSMVIGEGNGIGADLVGHPAIKAVGFTGSRGDAHQCQAAAAGALQAKGAGTMLTAGIHQAYTDAIEKRGGVLGLTLVARGSAEGQGCAAQAALYLCDAATFLANPALEDEIFGPASVMIACRDEAEILAIANHLEGQLTATVHATRADLGIAGSLLPILERKVGRILFNGFPTGVEVAHAMVHGGPFPATSDSRSTSVGATAIERFLRPVCYQDVPSELLPEALRDDNPLGLARVVDGVLRTAA